MRKIPHLIRRFIEMGVPVTSQVADDEYASTVLAEPELDLWRKMSPYDRRHSVGVATRFIAAKPQSTRDEHAAALLHDVGKSATSLGRLGRSVATVVPLTRAMVVYRDHERVGAEMLRAIGAAERVVALVSGTIDDPAARALRAADDA